MSINSVVLVGTLIGDPNMKYAASGLAITEFRIATPNQGDRPADQHNITVFGKQAGEDGVAGFCAQYLKKGSRVALQGKLQGQEFKTNTGKVIITTKVIAFSVEALDKIEE